MAYLQELDGDEINLDDVENEDVNIAKEYGIPNLHLWKQEFKLLWKPWAKSLIIKVIRIVLLFNFLV